MKEPEPRGHGQYGEWRCERQSKARAAGGRAWHGMATGGWAEWEWIEARDDTERGASVRPCARPRETADVDSKSRSRIPAREELENGSHAASRVAGAGWTYCSSERRWMPAPGVAAREDWDPLEDEQRPVPASDAQTSPSAEAASAVQ